MAPSAVQAMSSSHGAAAAMVAAGERRRLTRLLLNVTVEQSLWPVHVVLGADCTVADLVRAAVDAYVREGRRPPLLPPAAAAATRRPGSSCISPSTPSKVRTLYLEFISWNGFLLSMPEISFLL